MDKDEEIPYVAIGNEELKEGTQEKIDKLWGKKDPESGIKILSLLLSRGKTDEGKTLHCSHNCDSLYLVFPYDEPRKCKCGGIIKYEF